MDRILNIYTRDYPHLTPLVQTALLRRVSMRTSGVPISLTANLRISLMARGALFLNELEKQTVRPRIQDCRHLLKPTGNTWRNSQPHNFTYAILLHNIHNTFNSTNMDNWSLILVKTRLGKWSNWSNCYKYSPTPLKQLDTFLNKALDKNK